MKFLFQIALICLLIIVGFIFYEKYFRKIDVGVIQKDNITINNKEAEIKNNIIQNLTYNVKVKGSGYYEIKSNSSEVIIKDGIENILMESVEALFKDENNKMLYINSDFAEFNSKNYNTQFISNIKIKYEDNLITSNNLDFDFVNNNILVYNNVVYIGLDGKVHTDNIKINLISKNIEIYMNNKNNNIKAKSF